MKRIGNLFEKVYDKGTIRAAIMNASKGKRSRKDVRDVLGRIDFYIDMLHDKLKNGTYAPSDYEVEVVREGSFRKERTIYKPKFFPDQVVHWCIYITIREWIYKGMYVFSCGSVPKRGVHYGKRFVQKWVRGDRKNTKYYLKMDVRKFYPSIEIERLMTKLHRKFKDEKLLGLIGSILAKADGLPIGMLLSQVFANFYLSDVDHYIKQDLHAVYYLRYMDDMVVFGRNKKELHRIRKQIAEKLDENGLHMKDNWQVCRLDAEPLDFMGFRFFRDKTTLRRSIMLRITRKIKAVYKKGRAASYADACAVISYLGWIKHSDTHGLFVKWIKPYLHLGQMKNIIRRKQQNERIQEQQHGAAAGMGRNVVKGRRVSQYERDKHAGD